jgi:hypothetical protein
VNLFPILRICFPGLLGAVGGTKCRPDDPLKALRAIPKAFTMPWLQDQITAAAKISIETTKSAGETNAYSTKKLQLQVKSSHIFKNFCPAPTLAAFMDPGEPGG